MRKLTILIPSICILFVSCFAAYRGHFIWKDEHLVKMARAFIVKGDAANALLCLRKALALNPNNVAACRMMADFAEVSRSPEAVVWRSRVVGLEPESLGNRLALARVAVAAGDIEVAQRALDGVDDAGKETASYHRIAGEVNLTAKRLSEAEQHFSEAARLEPTNPITQMNLALVLMQKRDSASLAQGRAALQSLAVDPSIRSDVLRQLMMDALNQTNLGEALGYSGRVLQDTNSGFSDRMMHLGILHAMTNAMEGGCFAALQKEATTNSGKAYEVAKWMLGAGRTQAALLWLRALPSATRTNAPLPLIEADCCIAAGQWSSLLTNLATQSWGELDCLRLAVRSRAFNEQGSTASAKTEWIQTMKASGNQFHLLIELLTLTTRWNWQPEREEVLWAIANHYPRRMWAIQALVERLYATGNTRSLETLFGLLLQSDKENLAFKNNLAITALLLESWEEKPCDLAREVYTKSPTNASFASTYAYSLLVQRRGAEALKVMSRIPLPDLQKPSIAAYYGLVLKATGNTAKAKQCFDLAARSRLLPQERTLIDQAMRGDPR